MPIKYYCHNDFTMNKTCMECNCTPADFAKAHEEGDDEHFWSGEGEDGFINISNPENREQDNYMCEDCMEDSDFQNRCGDCGVNFGFSSETIDGDELAGITRVDDDCCYDWCIHCYNDDKEEIDREFPPEAPAPAPAPPPPRPPPSAVPEYMREKFTIQMGRIIVEASPKPNDTKK
jgi:hypothetical protein